MRELVGAGRGGRVGEAGCVVILDGDEAVVFADLAVRLHEEPTVQERWSGWCSSR